MYALKYTDENGQEKFICHSNTTIGFFYNVIKGAIVKGVELVDYLKDKTIVIISPPVESDDDI